MIFDQPMPEEPRRPRESQQEQDDHTLQLGPMLSLRGWQPSRELEFEMDRIITGPHDGQ